MNNRKMLEYFSVEQLNSVDGYDNGSQEDDKSNERWLNGECNDENEVLTVKSVTNDLERFRLQWKNEITLVSFKNIL